MKRSLIPKIGKSHSYIYGTATEYDLNTKCSSVSRLAKSQEEIAHVVNENISVINITRIEMSENRKALKELADKPGKFGCKIWQYYISIRKRCVSS